MVAVTVVAVGLFAIPLGVAVGRLYRSRETARLQDLATRAVGALPTSGLGGGDPIELPRGPEGVDLALYDAQGRFVIGVGPKRGGADVASALSGQVANQRANGTLSVSVPVHDEERVVGAARAATSWDTVAGRTHTAWLVMALLAVGAVGTAAALAQWEARRLAAPVEALAVYATRLGDGDFGIMPRPVGIAELDYLASSLTRTAARLGDVLARERAFTADASHQLSTPLTSLRLNLENAAGSSGDQREAIADAIVELERLEQTVATLLALARDAPQGRESCDVGAVCVDTAPRYAGLLAREGRRLRVDIDPELQPANCAPHVLSEILEVLLDNAVRHGHGEVILRARRAGAGTVVDVGDEGEGVRGDVDAVFTRRHPDSSGTGIGLALARSLAESQGGRLFLRTPGPHPIFSIALAAANSRQ
jgi:signal transduction histidine kinase